ncbi:MAG: HPr(Ser) kinase/phosphatase [candidate division WOR-3 bacterium]|nr:MAG: HPr(Ser) kinase/phosphatase [candidate division WOR-3 bacterium]
MKSLSLKTLYEEKKAELSLEIVTGEEHLADREITTYDIFRPGLALAGYTGYFLRDRIMIIGKTETFYLKTMKREIKDKRIATVMRLGTPVLIVTKKLPIDRKFIEEAKRRKIPILRTPNSTTPFIHSLTAYLDFKLAPTEYLQGTLVDIYGVGVLFIGKPGTGKSECALDLVERGHRFVADDLITIIRRGDILIGAGAEKSDRLKHHIEIRGVGIVDVYRIFGVKSVRLKKRIEVILELILWDDIKGEFDRIGLEKRTKEILGVEIPHIMIPLSPGKNISVIAEVIAMNYLLDLRGVRPAEEYDKELRRILTEREMPSVHFDEDIE